MTAALLPELAVLMVATADCLSPEVVSRPDARTLHLQRHDGQPLQDFTDRGVLARRCRPMCGQRARRWYRTPIDSRPLCRRCSRAAARLAAAGGVTHEQAVQQLQPRDVAALLDRARTPADVSQAVQLACQAQLVAATVVTDDGPVVLSRLVRDARRRVNRPSAVGPRDRNWADRLNPPGSRYPRRYR